MADKQTDRIIETAQKTGPSVLLILVAWVVLAVLILGAVWFLFFRT